MSNEAAVMTPLPVPAILEQSPGGRKLFAYSEAQMIAYAKAERDKLVARLAEMQKQVEALQEQVDSLQGALDAARASAGIT